MKKGLFWCIDRNADPPKFISVSADCDAAGNALDSNVQFTSKSGTNFNHAAEWQRLPKEVTKGKQYNYYPRGRVEVRTGKVTIFLNPVLNEERIVQAIKDAFDLTEGGGIKVIEHVHELVLSMTDDLPYVTVGDIVQSQQFNISGSKRSTTLYFRNQKCIGIRPNFTMGTRGTLPYAAWALDSWCDSNQLKTDQTDGDPFVKSEATGVWTFAPVYLFKTHYIDGRFEDEDIAIELLRRIIASVLE